MSATDITLTAGCASAYQFTVTESGAAVNLTGAAIYLEVWAAIPDRTVVTATGAMFTKSTSSGIVITNAAGGIFDVSFSKVDTNTVAPGTYYYGIEYIPAGQTDPRLIQNGNLIINPGFVRGV